MIIFTDAADFRVMQYECRFTEGVAHFNPLGLSSLIKDIGVDLIPFI
jgi:hypothetical protein